MAGTDIVSRITLDQVLAARQKAIAAYLEAHSLRRQCREKLAEAHQTVKAACLGHEQWTRSLDDLIDEPAEKFAIKATHDVDSRIWKALLLITGMGGLMDKQAHKQFEADLASNPPEVNADNVRATFQHMRANAKATFRRGLVNVFTGLCREYRSHDGFKIGNRIILEYGLSDYGSLSERHALADADRIMHILDGQRVADGWYSPLANTLEKAPRHTFSTGIIPGEVSTAYWRAKWFKKRTIHLYPLRPELVRRANKLIAEHFEDALGASPDAAGARRYDRARPHHHDVEDFYATSPAVAAVMVRAAELRPGMEVLEPSAGEGAIVKAILAAGLVPDCVEDHPGRADTLEDLLPPGAVTRMDFLAMHPEPIYDRILMNPPFGKGAGIQHVQHALRFLKPGGRLVAILGAGLEYRTDPATQELKALIAAWGGVIRPLPAGSFRHAGTNVETVIVRVDKPGLVALPAPEREAA